MAASNPMQALELEMMTDLYKKYVTFPQPLSRNKNKNNNINKQKTNL